MKYYVDYRNKSGDLTHVWCEANSPEDAASQVIDDYWDIDVIIDIWT